MALPEVEAVPAGGPVTSAELAATRRAAAESADAAALVAEMDPDEDPGAEDLVEAAGRLTDAYIHYAELLRAAADARLPAGELTPRGPADREAGGG